VPTCLAIVAAFLMIAQRNSMEIATRPLGTGKLIYGALLMSVAMYFTLATTSSMFLYFNF
jgi:alginate O-acetyltransferase complex protein AlgI